MYTTKEYSGMVTSKQKALDIYKYIKPEDGSNYISKASYSSKGKLVEVFDKETAKQAMFKFYFEGKPGPQIAEELGTDESAKVGFANGRTLTMLGFGIRESNKDEGIKADNQRGTLSGKVSAEEAQLMLNEVIEFVY